MQITSAIFTCSYIGTCWIKTYWIEKYCYHWEFDASFKLWNLLPKTWKYVFDCEIGVTILYEHPILCMLLETVLWNSCMGCITHYCVELSLHSLQTKLLSLVCMYMCILKAYGNWFVHCVCACVSVCSSNDLLTSNTVVAHFRLSRPSNCLQWTSMHLQTYQ